MSDQLSDIVTQSLEAMAANVQVYVDERVGNTVANTNIDRQIDALLKTKLGDALLASPNFKPTPAVSAIRTATVPTAEPTDLRNLTGMCPKTGTLIRGVDYLKSRLDDALYTPKRSQVLLRSRGSNIADLIDSPQNAQGALAIMAAIAQAIADPLSGVPDFVVTRIKILSTNLNGKMETQLYGKWLGNDLEITV